MKKRLNQILFLVIIITIAVISSISCEDGNRQKSSALIIQGDQCVKEGYYNSALTAYQEALAFDHNRDLLLDKIASVQFKLADYKNAGNTINQLLEISPEDKNVLKKAVQINLIIGDFEAANQFMDRLKNAAPDWAGTFEVLGEINVLLHNTEKAKEAFAKSLKISPDNPHVSIKLAQCFLAQNNPEQAKIHLNKVLEIKDKSAKLMVLISHYYKLEKNYSKVEQYLLEAEKLESQNLAVKKELVEFYYERAEYDNALTRIKEVLSKEKDNKTFTLLLVELLLIKNQYEEAQDVLLAIDKEMGNDINYLMLRGRIHLMVCESLSAIQYFSKVVELRPSNATANYLLSVAYLKNQNNHTAMVTLKQLLTLSKENNEIDLLLSTLYYKNKDYPVCLEYANRVIKRDPKNYRGHMIIGNCLLAQNNAQEAISYFQKASKIDTHATEPKYYTALCLESIGKWQKAFDIYLTMLGNNNGTLDVGTRCIKLASKYDQLDKLYGFLLSQRTKYSDSGFYTYLIGCTLLVKGKISEAISPFQDTIDTDPEYSPAYLKLSFIYKTNGANEKRIEILQRLIQVQPNLTNAYIELSDAFWQQRDYNKSLATVEKALGRGLKDPVLMNNYACILMELGQFSKAFEIAFDAHRSTPYSAFSADTLGWAYYNKKLYNHALWYLNEALKIEQDNAFIHYHLGLTLYALNKKKKATHHLKYALKNDLPDYYVPKIKEVLNSIK